MRRHDQAPPAQAGCLPSGLRAKAGRIHARPDAVLAIARELTDAGADWQLQAYGHAMHAFTFEGANNPQAGILYHPVAARRAEAALRTFLAQVLGDTTPGT
ncbi:hypothetical protein OV208_13075 [Corallococcus sp. bb12-1]|uniref:dienelactone hydrolase family protein n=1 Tax=Corallococcus sp. bb12-1 TaxID=2996784 RepID=UPI0022700213|nr:hypothetical protein [Corallococcus sp. bb12-1]MCY1042250.1 hypothetical protein [Corallococcus sp. bb12-1]